MTSAQRLVLKIVRQAPTEQLAAEWIEVFRRPATIEEAMAQRWKGLAICGELFRRGSISILIDGHDRV